MDSIGFIITEYLPFSQTFIYAEIQNVLRFKPVVFYHSLENLDIFPCDNLVHLKVGSWKLDHSFYGTSLLSRLKRGIPFVHAYNFYRSAIKKFNIKILHAQFGPEGVYALPIKERFNLPLVTSFRGWDVYSSPKVNPCVYDGLFDVGDVFLARSVVMRDDLISLGCPKDKIMVHHTGIDIKTFFLHGMRKPPKDGLVRILMVTRFVESKGIDIALEAVRMLSFTQKNFHLEIIGDGPLLQDMIELSRKLKITSFVSFVGFQQHSKILEKLLCSHIFLLTPTATGGIKEGGPNVLKEAQACGLPVVSTQTGGIPEVVLNNESGFLVDDGDVKGIVEKLTYLIENPEIWGKLGDSGRKHIEQEFNVVTQTEQLEKIYDTLLH